MPLIGSRVDRNAGSSGVNGNACRAQDVWHSYVARISEQRYLVQIHAELCHGFELVIP